MKPDLPNTAFESQWNAQLFGIQRSIRYHARRQAFYDFWNTLTNASSIILGAGTVMALLDSIPAGKELRLLFPAAITVIATLNLVWGTSRAARLHNDLYRRFVELEQEMVSVNEVDEAFLRAIVAKRLLIEADEPPVKFALNVICHNELVKANGGASYYQVSLLQRLAAHVWPFDPTDFPPAAKTN